MGHVPDPDADEAVEQWLAEGWRPSRFVERAWIRGGGNVIEGPDHDVVTEEYDEMWSMTPAEEEALVHRVYEDPDAAGLQPFIVEPDYTPDAPDA